MDEKVMEQRRVIEFGQIYAEVNYHEAVAEVQRWRQKEKENEGKTVYVSELREIEESIDLAQYRVEKWSKYMRVAKEMVAAFDAEHHINGDDWGRRV